MTIKMANHRRRRKFNWLSNVFQKVMLLLLLTILTKSAEAGGVSLKGGDLSCSQPGVNFTNILQAAFSYESALHYFYQITVWL
jgi:hypothetical protein